MVNFVVFSKTNSPTAVSIKGVSQLGWRGNAKLISNKMILLADLISAARTIHS